ncbi:GMC family oxidoreductase [Flavobacterium sp. IMCC34852]|uniref:GMC family oxidoreductase n=1 Tax=Flavobacterium rivulicola TaxID=2732161 RepID=A0A7Y3R7W3_9FLAO|nr:GMC family oxidoreductase [Flavobacterium sp. IMCC34852]NNT71578.1 GMC family oxidoreductase [Flavobacterium sp. IMCC34852]
MAIGNMNLKINDMEQDDFDVVIIGAGICGAITAYKLAEENHKVLLLEAGTGQTDRIAFAGNYATAVKKHPGSPYATAGPGYISGPDNDNKYYIHETNSDKFKSTFLRIKGGTTWHFLGNVPRFLPSDFRLNELYKVGDDWPLTYDDIEEDYCTAEMEIGVAGDHKEWNDYMGAHRSKKYPMEKIWQAYGDSVFIEKVNGQFVLEKEIKIMGTPQARNATAYNGRPACAGNSTCVPICPIQAKYDATVHIKKAIEKGTALKTDCVVKKLIKDDNGQITEIVYLDRTTKKNVKIDTTGKIVVLAAHAIETPRLLLHSGLATKSNQVGKNLMDHLQGYCVAISKNPVYPFRGPITTSGIDVFRDGGYRNEFGAFRLSIGNDGWGRIESPFNTLWDNLNSGFFGRELADRVSNRVICMTRISFSTEMLPKKDNSVTLSATEMDEIGIPKPVINFKFEDYNKKAMKYAFEVCKRIFELADCKVDEEKSQVTSYSGAGHIMGTTKMGTDEENSVVDSFGCCHEHRNLYIVGPSVFVTSGTANPTLTAAALSIRTARKINEQLRAQK